MVAPDDEDDLEDEEWYETPRPSPTSRPRNDIANSKPRSRQPRQTTRAWKETLSRLHSTTEQTPAIRSAALPPGHEIVYVVDIQASLAGNGLVLEVATRNRKRDGEWSKPKGRRFALSEIEHLPEPADRQAMAILAGGREQVSGYYSGRGYYDQRPGSLPPHARAQRGPAADALRHGPVPAAGIGAGRLDAATPLG